MSKILLLPGIGDQFWVFVAMQSFIAKHNLGVPDVYIWNFDGRPRSLEYVERIPFVRAAGYFDRGIEDVPEFNESYNGRRGRSVYHNLLGFDYYLSANAALRWGRTVEEAFPGLATDWYFPLERTLEEDAAAAQYRDRYGDYIVAFLSDHGMFRHWVRKWGLTGCVQFIHEIQVATRMPVLLTGCAWDRPFAAQVAGITDAINLAGSTDIDRFFGLLRNARGMVGWCGGNTIKSTYFRVPTLIGWSRFFSDPRFYRNACPPDSWDRWYKAFVVEQTNPKQAARMFVQLMESASMVQR